MDNSPFVSVIMPIRNEGRFIERSLDCVFAQDYPRERIEVLVADGMSTDGTRDIVKSIQSNHPNSYLIDNAGRIVASGLNAALPRAAGQIIIRVDGHTQIAPDYVRQCVAVLERSRADNVGGKMMAAGEGAFGQAVALATSSRFGVGGARFHYSDKEEWVDTVYMGAWPRHVFARIGLFDEELVRDQDDEFNYRLLAHGGRILLSPRIRSVYAVRSSPCSLWRQYFQYGYWKVRVLQKHSRQIRLRQFAPPLFVASLLGAIVVAMLVPFGWFFLALIVSVYALANVLASIWVVSHREWRYLLLLPLVFAILHLSYGSGFLVGLIKFAFRWQDKIGGVPSWGPGDG